MAPAAQVLLRTEGRWGSVRCVSTSGLRGLGRSGIPAGQDGTALDDDEYEESTGHSQGRVNGICHFEVAVKVIGSGQTQEPGCGFISDTLA